MQTAIRQSRAIFTALNRDLEGSLSTRTLSRLLYTLHTVHWNGTLHIRDRSGVTSHPVVAGVPGCCTGSIRRQRQVFLTRFGFPDADYRVEGHGPDVPAGYVGFGDPKQLILEGVFGHLGFEELLWELGRFWRHYPVPTQHLDGWGGQLGRGGVRRLLAALCTGQHTTRELIGSSPRSRLPLVRALYYAVEVDLIGMASRPTDATIDLVYTNLRHGHGERRDGPERRARPVADVYLPSRPTTASWRPLPPETRPTQERVSQH